MGLWFQKHETAIAAMHSIPPRTGPKMALPESRVDGAYNWKVTRMGRMTRGMLGAAFWATVGVIMATGGAGAQEIVGLPTNYQFGLQEPASPNMVDIRWFHDSILLPIITVITVFVMLLLIIVMVRFNSRSNPTPSRTTHNTTIEVLWTVVPILILVAIAIPSFRILYEQRTIPDADMTIKATGHQWYWSYEYPDHEDLAFDSIMLEDDELGDGKPRLLSVDNAVVVPAGKTVRVLVTAADVIHNWAMPAFGIKMDGIPGRINETWFKVDQPGIYYGQCSELCGVRHAFMPIELHVLAEADFATWLENAKVEFASAPAAPVDDKTRTAALAAAPRTAR
jgi:cytochrome c oxidase subunit 2